MEFRLKVSGKFSNCRGKGNEESMTELEDRQWNDASSSMCEMLGAFSKGALGNEASGNNVNS